MYKRQVIANEKDEEKREKYLDDLGIQLKNLVQKVEMLRRVTFEISTH